MRCMDALNFLNANLQKFQEDYGVARLWLVGSTARDKARPNSDIDLIVEFITPSYRHYAGLKRYLEDSLDTGVDLLTPNALKEKPRFRQIIERDAILITGSSGNVE